MPWKTMDVQEQRVSFVVAASRRGRFFRDIHHADVYREHERDVGLKDKKKHFLLVCGELRIPHFVRDDKMVRIGFNCGITGALPVFRIHVLTWKTIVFVMRTGEIRQCFPRYHPC